MAVPDVAGRITGLARRLPVSVVWIIGLLPMAWLALQTGRALAGLPHALGADPVKTLEHSLGLHALQFLLASLAISPLRRLSGIALIRFRRPLGLLAFTYLVAHLAVWAVLDVQTLSLVIEDLTRRTYIVVGLVAFLCLVPLAVTSTDRWIRRLGAARWKRLHRLAYPAALLGAVHFVMSVKGTPPEPLVYLVLTLVLLGMRLPLRRKPLSRRDTSPHISSRS